MYFAQKSNDLHQKTKPFLPHHLSLITHFTIYGLWSLRRVCSNHLLSEKLPPFQGGKIRLCLWRIRGLLVSCILSFLQFHSFLLPVLLTLLTVTESFKELSWIPQSESVEVSLVWMSSWYWKVMFSVELEFLSDDTKWFLCEFTLYSPIEYIIWYIFYILWKLLCRDDLVYLRKWWFVVRPVEARSVEEGFCFCRSVIASGMK